MDTIRRLSVRAVLDFLAQAGPDGAITTAIAEAHDYPVSYNHRSNYATTILRRLEAQGEAELLGTERSPRYRGAPVTRWRLTPDGHARQQTETRRDEAEAGAAARLKAAAQAREEALAAVREEIAERVRLGGLAFVTRTWRDARVAELRAVPCTLNEIGQLFGLTREAVRVIELRNQGLPRSGRAAQGNSEA